MGIERWVREARMLAQQGRYDDAVYVWRDVLAYGEPTAMHHVEIALCLVELGAGNEALFELQTALALDSAVREAVADEHRFSEIWDEL